MRNIPFEIQALKSWFVEEARDLPWRRNPTPYAVWISEVMLQQTQVAVVREYYLRWMERFPNVEALAHASLTEVIKMWEGLGYYSRARNLHSAANYLIEHHHGVLPSERGALSKIRGLGPYTIGAILSFAFHQRAAAVDGNVIRVLTRYFGIDENVQKSRVVKKIWEIAEKILPEEEPWLIVEGLIDLGASICKKEAHCWSCPLRQSCIAFKENRQEELPKKEKKRTTTALHRAVYVIVHEGSVLLKKGLKGQVMADLYEFPYLEHKESEFPFPFAAKKVKKLQEVAHGFTRYRAKLYPTLWQALERQEVAGYEWICMDRARKYPFSAGHRKIWICLGEDNAHLTH